MSEPKLSRREAIRFRRRRPTKITIPERVSPHVKLVFTEMQRQNRRYEDVVEGSGVQRAALKAWRHKNYPTLTSLEAVLGYLGFDFVPIPREKVLPSELVDELQPIAEKFVLSMPETIATLVGIITGIHARFAPDRLRIGGTDQFTYRAPSTAPTAPEMTATI